MKKIIIYRGEIKIKTRLTFNPRRKLVGFGTTGRRFVATKDTQQIVMKDLAFNLSEASNSENTRKLKFVTTANTRPLSLE